MISFIFDFNGRLLNFGFVDSDDFISLGITDFDVVYFQTYNRRLLYLCDFDLEVDIEDAPLGKRRRV